MRLRLFKFILDYSALSNNWSDMPVLKDSRHEHFAQLVARGETSVATAYQKCYKKAKRNTAEVNGSILRNTKCAARIEELKLASATATTLTMQERREFLARIVRTPVGDVDERSPLCQEVAYSETQNGTNRKYKMPDKRQSIMDDAKLAGDLDEKIEVTGSLGISIDAATAAALLEHRKQIRMAGIGTKTGR